MESTDTAGEAWPKKFIVTGRDEFGNLRLETVVSSAVPSLYFWLGIDAYPEWPSVTKLVFSEVSIKQAPAQWPQWQ